jgi:hypothetical protein
MKDAGTVAYLAWSVPVIVVLTVGSILLERGVNQLTKRVTGARRSEAVGASTGHG